jgi:hypothetical protein
MTQLDSPLTALVLILIGLVLLLIRVMAGRNNLQWSQFISSKGSDGKHYADLDKLGKVVGIVISSWAIVKITSSASLDLTGFSLVFGAYLAFVGGVAGYSAYLRYRRDK